MLKRSDYTDVAAAGLRLIADCAVIESDKPCKISGIFFC